MSGTPFLKSSSKAIAIDAVSSSDLASKIKELTTSQRKWANASGFEGKEGQILLLPAESGAIGKVLFGHSKSSNPLQTGKLASSLPKGAYKLSEGFEDLHLASVGWGLGGYSFGKYRNSDSTTAQLVLPSSVDGSAVKRDVDASNLARDLINTPANDMGPDQLEAEIRKIGKVNKASISVIKGEALLKKNFPMIHAVGRASADAPRLIDLKWGNAKHPKVTLVGKGVIFDSGGLNIKPGNSMALMKKDMGGAANTIALAKMIMEAKLPVRLRLLVPAVENAISGNAFRPGDILPSRKGITVEIGNTDAEGRLILGDALALGDEETPDLMIDMATLTGAARVALGPDLPPYYSGDEIFASSLDKASQEVCDPLWRMPLWDPYQKMLSSKVADVNHISTGGFAGSITAALFLSRFVENARTWAHFDIYGWTPTAKPWAPVGGEAQGIRALFKVIAEKY
ncbi:MAG: leucyl aminopeptidase family protein [Rhizobiaceae bacterium]|nr:leucyl aminopeptidase family protein [Rhizobiaceae bacterium]